MSDDIHPVSPPLRVRPSGTTRLLKSACNGSAQLSYFIYSCTVRTRTHRNTQQLSPPCPREPASKRALHPIHNVKQPENRDQRTDVRHLLTNRALKFVFLKRSRTTQASRSGPRTKRGTTCPLSSALCPLKLVELNGFESMTPCLQSRCSPS